MEEFVSMLIVVCILALLFIIFIFVSKIMDTYYNIKDKRFDKKYPDFVKMREDYYNKISNASSFYNSKISISMSSIDNMEKKKKYLPKEEREKLEIKIEEEKEKLFEYEKQYKCMENDNRNFYYQIEEYKINNNIKD